MKKLLKTVLALFLLAGILTGCDNGDDGNFKGYKDIFVVGGNLSNAPEYNYDDILNHIAEACTNGGSALLVCPDGSPYSNSISYKIKELTPDRTANYNKQEAASYANEIIQDVKSLEAKTDEVNLFATFEMMHNFFSNSSDDRNIAIIVNNGLTTTAPLDLSKYDNVIQLKGHSKDIIDSLSQQGLTFDLKGLTIFWYGFGETNIKTQQPLTSEEIEILKQVYIDYFAACNATIVFEKITSKENTNSELPAISPVSTKSYQNVNLS